MRNLQQTMTPRRCFLALWAAVCLLKLVVAASLPLFVD
jgi:hypothetical protein